MNTSTSEPDVVLMGGPKGPGADVSIVIVQYGAVDPLKECLNSLFTTVDVTSIPILVVVNGFERETIESLQNAFPTVLFKPSLENVGYAGAANIGLDLMKTKYVLLLNNDVIAEGDWLNPLLRLAEEMPDVAAIQPKILSMRVQGKFDYAGGCGGYLDSYGFPFTRGRIFDTIERDRGQYDDEQEVFWASGAVFFMRRRAVLEVGGFDDRFFIYHEETDLCWRLHLRGFRVMACPKSRFLHAGSSSFKSTPQTSRLKLYMMHRNGLLMVIKNLEAHNLRFRLPVRILLEIVSWFFLVWRNPSEVIESMKALFWICGHTGLVRTMRQSAQAYRRVPDSHFAHLLSAGMLPLQYYVGRVRTFRDVYFLSNPGAMTGSA